MLLRSNQCLALLIFFLEEIIDALQRFGFQLVDDVVKNLQAGDVDHTVVVWRVWNLDSDTEHSDENRGQVRTADEGVVRREEAGLRGDLLEHSENHPDKGSDNVDFIHDAANERVLSGEMELVLFKRVVKGKNISVERDHLLIDHVIEFGDANLHDLQLDGVLANRKHDLRQHEGTFEGVAILSFLALGSELLDFTKDRINVLVETSACVLLVLVEHDHGLHGPEYAVLGLQLDGVGLKALEE
jgi:hypothetical protein